MIFLHAGEREEKFTRLLEIYRVTKCEIDLATMRYGSSSGVELVKRCRKV
jgi:hypothetical protein